ncbi:TetR family transcriptional regulator [Actinomadura logoneensis]|uniref:TetR family transcriptional regulator n=1 Tax=Actinomadura logoneensis TaxID=2293572 RepID=A0A372JIP6_9ACTN|nr:TetR family transcriptional regulator [Actinomadura logoneensis]RFU39885.1 TetR family transcriptional regulator [Actinomadura logoneensis]
MTKAEETAHADGRGSGRKAGEPKAGGRTRRRAPQEGERKLDAERSKRLLLDAALEEFSAKGYAGARVQDIADRAGVNKQLISYHYGGKAGLYAAIGRSWAEREAEFATPDVPLPDLIVRYLEHSLDEPRATRLNAWMGLTGDYVELPGGREDMSDLRRRQGDGELAADLDPEMVMLVMMAAVAVPTTMPNIVRYVTGMDAASPEFRARYADQLRRVVARLADPAAEPEASRRTSEPTDERTDERAGGGTG